MTKYTENKFSFINKNDDDDDDDDITLSGNGSTGSVNDGSRLGMSILYGCS